MINRKRELSKKYKNYNYNDRKTVFADWDTLRPDQQALLAESNIFCMYPWLHIYADPSGQTELCCNTNRLDGDSKTGNLREQTLEQVFNDTRMRETRVKMLNETPCAECSRCYEQEANGFVSMRNSANKHHGHFIDIVDTTQEDGTVPDFKMRYWDIRFSNLCNLKCRSCGPDFSSNWYDDHAAILEENGHKPYQPKLIHVTGSRNKDSIWDQLKEHVPYVQQIYFAGGEPLIMDEHYFILQALIDAERTDVKLAYNTNFTKLQYKSTNVLDMWQHFPDVSVGASLDGMGAVAELVRSGTDWQQVVKNRQQMLETVPDIDFYISPTVSIMNVFHVAEFHRLWIEQGLLDASSVHVNILINPDHYRIDVLPAHLKERATRLLEDHVAYLKQHDTLGRAITGFESAIRFMNATDNSHLIPEFNRISQRLDRLRNESIYDVVPELRDLL